MQREKNELGRKPSCWKVSGERGGWTWWSTGGYNLTQVFGRCYISAAKQFWWYNSHTVSISSSLFVKEKQEKRLHFLQDLKDEAPVFRGSDKDAACGAELPPNRLSEWVKWQRQCGTVRMPRTGTGAIRSVHNGSAQVAQVVVCHACVCCTADRTVRHPRRAGTRVWEKMEGARVNIQKRLSLIMSIITWVLEKFKFHSKVWKKLWN